MDYEYNKLSQTQKDAVDVMKYHNKTLTKQKGFWTYEGCHFKSYKNGIDIIEIPDYSCRITTLRVLAKLKIVELDEEHGVCQLI